MRKRVPTVGRFHQLMADRYLEMREHNFRVPNLALLMARLLDAAGSLAYMIASRRVYREPHHMRDRLIHLAAMAQIAAEDLGFIERIKDSP